MNVSRFTDYGIPDPGQFIAIFSDNTFEKFPIIKMAKMKNPVYIGEHTIIDTFSVYNDPQRPKFSFNIYNSQLERTTIKINDWKCTKFVHWYYDGAWIRELTLSDPLEESRTIRLNGEHQHNERALESIINLIEDIKEFSWLKCWESYDLYCDNIRLRKKVELLKSKVKKLKTTNR